MNFDLSDEQIFLSEAARGALARHKTIEAAHQLLDGEAGPDLWPAACEAGWPGLLIGEEQGGAGLGALDAMLVSYECGRVLASVPLLGHVPATAILAAGEADAGLLGRLASGEARAATVLARPPSSQESEWTVDAQRGAHRDPAPQAAVDGGTATLTGHAHWVPDLPGAEVIVVVAASAHGPVAVVLSPDADGVTVTPATVYDATRSLGHLELAGASGQVLHPGEDELASAWYLAQCLIAAESLGAVESGLEMAVAYAKERFTFGRAIGSYQAVKHGLVEILRLQENARSLMYYAGWARQDAPREFPLAASAARTAAGHALDYAAREVISVHGGIGATWEHDAPLYFRRAQLSRRLLGGANDATDRVADELLAAA
ncbi:MAG: acyl-CoA dehydrogenase family protein [Solirubrobacteraceae bacterium]